MFSLVSIVYITRVCCCVYKHVIRNCFLPTKLADERRVFPQQHLTQSRKKSKMSLLEKLHVFQLLRSLLVADGRAFSLFFVCLFFSLFCDSSTSSHHHKNTHPKIIRLSLSLSFSLSSDEEEEVKKKKKTKKTKNVVVFVCL